MTSDHHPCKLQILQHQLSGGLDVDFVISVAVSCRMSRASAFAVAVSCKHLDICWSPCGDCAPLSSSFHKSCNRFGDHAVLAEGLDL